MLQKGLLLGVRCISALPGDCCLKNALCLDVYIPGSRGIPTEADKIESVSV